jgi:hypothetical protein
VVDERYGVWGKAQPEPGAGSLLSGMKWSNVDSVSCGKPGYCAAVGSGEIGDIDEGFVVNETNGVWRAAHAVPGLAAISAGSDNSSVDVVSCTAAKDCSAAGWWYAGRVQHGFVVSESNGTWGKAIAIPGPSSLYQESGRLPLTLSCAAPGDCSAVAIDGTGEYVVNESGGVWGTAEQIPGLLNASDGDQLGGISCWAVGSCEAVGVGQISGSAQDFFVTERAGIWQSAQVIPGLSALTGDGFASPTTISCDSTGDCAAGGVWGGGANFVVDEIHGVWHDAANVKNGGGQNTEISCGAGDHCVIATDVRYGTTGEVASGPILPPSG